ncbi:uncharacterized protein LOC133845109 [Drosophila sulfurigaster albostrigata]|uniref:uncharacterized protein LOC133845109 n=1 Tax=Drosophila sulfurigaster albostrigata TaxID=89887 RepID=UPI002D21A94B|nr:uncharacterized protein LOC133845109 [Drosophila sulfurigaster albostrigata]
MHCATRFKRCCNSHMSKDAATATEALAKGARQQQKATPPPKPQRGKRKPSATPTSILCELMRLKAQQKYLECNQVKLNASNFLDDNDPGGDIDIDIGAGEDSLHTASRRPSSGPKVSSLINDIDRLKLELDEKLQKYRIDKRGQLQDMWHYMQTLKEDVFKPERLSLYTVNAVRERIIGLNGQLERLNVQNSKELESLKQEFDQMERENKFVWKDSM